MNDTDVDFTLSFSKLAAICEVDRGTLRSIRDRDSRFPAPVTTGWSIGAVKLLLAIRRFEKMSDADYAEYCEEYELSPPAKGARQETIRFFLDCMETLAQ